MNNYVSFEVAKLLKELGWSKGTQGGYVLQPKLKDPSKKWDRYPKLNMSRLDDVLFYCNTENEDGTKTYPDLVEEDWVEWEYAYTRSVYVINTDDENNMMYDWLEAPMILDVIEWLREEHGYCVGFKNNPTKIGSYTWELAIYDKEDTNGDWEYQGTVKESYHDIVDNQKDFQECTDDVFKWCLNCIRNHRDFVLRSKA